MKYLKGSLSLLSPYFSENKTRICLGLLSLIIVDILQLLIPRVVKHAVDGLTALNLGLEQLLLYSLSIAALAAGLALFRYFWRRCLLGTSRRIEEGLRNRLFSHLLRLSPAYFDRTKTGDLMAHASNDINQIRMASGMGLVALNDALFLGLAAIGFMGYIDWGLTLFVLLPMPGIIIGTKLLTQKIYQRYKSVQASFSELTEAVRERIAGIRLIKAYNLEGLELGQVGSHSKQYLKENMSLVRITGGFMPMLLLFSNLSLAIFLFVGGRKTIQAEISTGDFVAFISYLRLLTWPMMAMGWVVNLIQRGRASLGRIKVVLDTEPEIQPLPPIQQLNHKFEGLVFEGVDFAYPSAREIPVLAGINLKLGSGGSLGITGPQGSGKTSLIRLIPRLYDVSQGRVCINSRDIRQIPLEEIRGLISFVPQNAFLFAGTIRENISFETRKTDETTLLQALEQAAVLNTVLSLPQGLDTPIGEKGVILSGGQKQRIALARAFLQPRPILILDDPVSQVDNRTGNAIIRNIQHISREKTTIIISHRLSALSAAETIISLENGRIVESGTHEQLLANNHFYARIAAMQEIEEKFHEL